MTNDTQQFAHQSINFGVVSRFYLIGGGQTLFDAARYLNCKKYDVTVLTSERHHAAYVRHDDSKIRLWDALSLINVESHLSSKFDAHHEAFKNLDSQSLLFTPSSEWIFTQEIIDSFNGRIVNIHGSALPEMKGGGGLSWNLMMGEREGGCTIHLVDAGIDTGDILLQQKYRLPDSVLNLEDALAYASNQNTQLTLSFFEKIESQATFNRTTQSQEAGSYWPRLKTDIHGFVDWNWSASEISSFVCAFGKPFKGASTFLAEKKVRIAASEYVVEERNFHPFQYGLVFRVSDKRAYVACRGGSLVISDIFDDAGQRLDLNKLSGRRLHTPIQYLEAALRQRVVFAPVSEYDEYRTNL